MQEQPSGKIRVVVLEGYQLLRAGFKLIIEQANDMVVVGNTGDIYEALDLVSSLKPNIILLSSLMNTSSFIELIPKLINASCGAQLIVLSGLDQSMNDLKVFQSGAYGIVLKTQSPEILVKAIRKVHEGEVWIERSRMASIINSITHDKPSDLSKLEVDRINLLSKREREVVVFIGQMMKNQQIADQLGISEVTVRHHLTSIYNKLEVQGRLELLVFSRRHNLSKA